MHTQFKISRKPILMKHFDYYLRHVCTHTVYVANYVKTICSNVCYCNTGSYQNWKLNFKLFTV